MERSDDHEHHGLVIELSAVSVRKRSKEIVSDVSLRLCPGVTALLGRNGAGKTTLIRVMAGVHRPTTGTVTAGGSGDLFESKSAMRKYLTGLGWVPQDPGYPAGMRADRFVEYAAWLKGMHSTERRAAALQALTACNVGVLGPRSMGSLSGGERQRVVLAAAVVNRPRILLLDEPTAGLDPAQRESYLALLRDLGEDTIVLYSSHLVDDVVRVAGRVLVLDRGRLSTDMRGPELAAPADRLGESLRQAVINSQDRNTQS